MLYVSGLAAFFFFFFAFCPFLEKLANGKTSPEDLLDRKSKPVILGTNEREDLLS